MSSTLPPPTDTVELTREDQALIRGVVAPTAPRGLRVLLPVAHALGLSGVALLLAGVVVLVLLAGTAAGAIPLPNIFTLTIYLPVADKSMNVVPLVGIGFAVGILSGMTGVGGGFLMTPLLMTIGIPSAVAVGTDSAQIAGTASSGALGHSRLGNVDVKLGLVILVGALIGGTVGVRVVYLLREMGNFDFCVRIVYIIMLGSVGSFMLREAVRTWVRSTRPQIIRSAVGEGSDEGGAKLVAREQPDAGRSGGVTARWPLQMDFHTSKIRASLLFPFGLGLSIGLLTALMGVGGGFIMVPAMIYILGVPTHVAVGTSLFQMVFTSSNVAFQQAITNHNVDILLGVLLLVGAAIGAQVGARMSGRLEGHQLRTILSVIVLLVMIKLLFDLLMAPGSVFGVVSVGGGGH